MRAAAVALAGAACRCCGRHVHAAVEGTRPTCATCAWWNHHEEDALGMRCGAYVSGRARPIRAFMWRSLRDAGWPINSTWIDGPPFPDLPDQTEMMRRLVEEIAGSRVLLLYVEEHDLPLTDALVEVGMALASGIPVRAVVHGLPSETERLRRLGTWLRHPLVKLVATPEEALSEFCQRWSREPF